MTGEMVVLPLRSDLGEVSPFLGGLSLEAEIGRTPRRLTIREQSRTGLTGLGGPDANPLRGFADETQQRPLSDTRHDRPGGRAPGTEPQPARKRMTGLRLVVNNERAN